jgi:hypothetical protein
MWKNPTWLYKSLVIGFIVLFIGVGVQPAVAKIQPYIIDFKPENMDKEELTAIINEIQLKYGHIPMISYICNIFFTFIGLYVLYAIAVITFVIVGNLIVIWLINNGFF